MLTFAKKLYLGFSIVIILLALVGSTAYFALTNASYGFEEYRSLARATNAVGRVQANMLMARIKVKDFILTGSINDKEEFDTYLDHTQQYMAEALLDVDKAKDVDVLKGLDSTLDIYAKGFEKVVDFKKQRNELVENVLNINGPTIELNLTKILVSAKDDGDVSAAYNASLSTRSLLLARLYVLKFLESNDQASVDRVGKEFADLEVQLKILGNELQNPARKVLLDSVVKDVATYEKAFNDVVAVILDRNAVINDTLNPVGSEVAKLTEDLKLSIKNEQDK